MAKKRKARKTKAKSRKPTRKRKRPTKKKAVPNNKRKARAERELEEGLRETFPSSDPLALTDPTRSIKE
jgi:hypothetical protein